MLITNSPKPTRSLLRQERLRLQELVQLQKQDWRTFITEGTQVCILDDLSFRQLRYNLNKSQKCIISNINQSIIRQSTDHDADQISQKQLIQGLSLDSPASTNKLRVITYEMNNFIFHKLGCKGYQIKRKVIKVDDKRYIDLYPKFNQFQILSLQRLQRLHAQQKDLRTVSFAPNLKYRLQYVQKQKGEELYQKIQALISPIQLIERSNLRIYIFNPLLFSKDSFQRLLTYYFNREDIRKPASDIQAQFYKIIDNKEFDQFVVQFLPGKLIDRNSNIMLKENDKLIVEIQQTGKWVFPQQPSFLVVKNCSSCNLLTQLQLKFSCQKCKKDLFFCSRVCEYQALLSHLCNTGKQTLQILYGKENIPAEKDTEEPQGTIKQNEKRGQNNQNDDSFEQFHDKIKDKQILDSPYKTAQKSSQKQSNKFIQSANRIASPKQFTDNKSKKQFLDVPNVSKPSQQTFRGGIENPRNNCYMNSVLQLTTRTSLSHILQSKKFETNTLSFAFINLLKQLQNSSEKTPVRKKEMQLFKDVVVNKLVKFKGQQQEDAHEFFTSFLDKIHDEFNQCHQKGPIAFSPKAKSIQLNPYSHELQARNQWFQFISNYYSPLIDQFFGQTIQTTKCPHCYHQSVKFTPFNSIVCTLPETKRMFIKHQSFNFSERVQRLQVVCRGTVQDMLMQLKTIKKLDAKGRYLKLFKTGLETQCQQIPANTQLQKIQLYQSDKLVVFESEYAQSSMFVVKFIDNNKSFTFKRPLFFKEHSSSVTSKMLYKAVGNYFKNILKIYLQGEAVLKKIEDKMSENIQFFFTLAYYQEAKVPGKKSFLTSFLPNDQTIFSFNIQNMRQICVLLKSPQKGFKDLYFHQKFYNLIQQKINKSIQTKILLGSASQPLFTLEDCLKSDYNKKSVLDEKNQWYCPSCQQKRRAHLSNSLYKLPPNVFICLKRFLPRTDGSIQKNETRVKVPLHLNMKSLLKNPKIPQAYYLALTQQEKKALKIQKQNIDDSKSYQYGLKGIILHRGELDQGHYKAVVIENGLWIEYNDQKCRVVDIGQELQGWNQSNIYMLWYCRITQ